MQARTYWQENDYLLYTNLQNITTPKDIQDVVITQNQ